MALNNATYSNSHFIVYNGVNLTYTQEACAESFDENHSFTGSLNMPQ